MVRMVEREVHAAGLRWRVQASDGPGLKLLLVHGTGASLHSWQRLLPHLLPRFAPLAMDLPGHGETSRAPPSQLTLDGMGAALGDLLQAAGAQPDIVVGHSAGAAVLARMVLDGRIAPRAIVAINGAFLPFGGPLAPLFSPLAKMLYAQGWLPKLFARRAADRAVVRRMIEGTGSFLDDDGVAAYQQLVQRPGHSEAALGMMAHWDLRALEADLPRLPVPLHLWVGERDIAVPPSQARRVAQIAPRAQVSRIAAAGHLAHEEQPAAVAAMLHALADQAPVQGARV